MISIFGAGGKEGKNTISKVAEEMNKTEKWSSSSPYHAFRHELGHALQKHLKDTVPDYEERLKKIREIRDAFFKSLTGLDEDDIMELKKKALSVYGLTDDEELDEFIAECVAEYCSKKPRKMSRVVVIALLHKGGNGSAG
ncbi:MAG: V-type ATP synthase subunit E family protein [Ruminococcus callidus]|nr:V-type ATP synthase subunit E family protein [Ruminococcus callidus]